MPLPFPPDVHPPIEHEWPGSRDARAARPPVRPGATVRRSVLAGIMSVGIVPLAAGCHSMGPVTVARDRSEYAASISESWKRQTLLNIVKLRYLDPPVFVDVGQIVAGYTLETQVNAGASFPQTDSFGGTTGTVGAAGRYTDRPTITYTPLTGNRFVRSLMMPLPPESVFFTIQSGWPADAVLYATAASINGLKNQETSVGGVSPPDPRFLRVLELMRKLQLSGAVGLRVQPATLLTLRTNQLSPEAVADGRELRTLLGLDPDAAEFRLAFGGTATSDKEVAILTRSILHVMQTMASQVRVPPADVSEGRVTPGWEDAPGDAESPRLVRVYSSKGRPRNAFVAVRYRDHWFWIDDRDLKTKRTFAFMMMLFTLADPGDKENLPLITIPAQ
jgi:hypothetical protein